LTVSEDRSVVAQIGAAVFGEGSVAFYFIQGFTAAILILAANTAYQDFPRLSSILARDRFMPSQFRNRGDRLVFSNGVIGLALASIVVIIVFDANLTRLIQMYVVGVFTSFTLSQSGMVRHWWRERLKGDEAARGWRVSIVINAIGAVTTGVVLLVVVSAKFLNGAWLSILVMILIVPGFLAIHRHYGLVAEFLRRGAIRPDAVGSNHVVLIVRDLGPAAAEAIGYIRSLRPADLHVLYQGSGGALPEGLLERWRGFAGAGIPDPTALPGRSLRTGVEAFVRTIERGPSDFITLVVAEDVSGGLFSYVVRRRDLIWLKARMLLEPNVVVTDVPVRMAPKGSLGVGARPLIPHRIVTLVFVSNAHDAAVRAVNYARTLGAAETRAVYFDMDPEEAHQLERQWFEKGFDIPLDILEAPFRDLTTPMLGEVRRYTVREDTLVNVIVPEVVVTKRRHLLLHNQNALFIKRLFLFEDRAVLTSVPLVFEESPTATAHAER
jgi:hypothetical protein